MNISIINGFPFHYEMYGYIIHYCKVKNYNLTIFDIKDNDFVDFYNKIFEYPVSYRPFKDFNNHFFDVVILTTDNDNISNFITTNSKIISITHTSVNRNKKSPLHIPIRPFNVNQHNYILPVFPILNTSTKIKLLTNTINIVILGDSVIPYNVNIINRIRSTNTKIIIHAISRNMNMDKFNGIKHEILIHKNIKTKLMFDILSNSSYILLDVNENKDYVHSVMSSSIPLSFGVLSKMIISKQMNSYYKFKNVVEYDKYSDNSIDLENSYNVKEIEDERNDITYKNILSFEYYLN
jgi:hypothetical protein